METLPRFLRQSSGFPFVGRTNELETLRTLIPRAAGEGCRVVLVGGEPGSGKSRLMREFARASWSSASTKGPYGDRTTASHEP